MTDNNIIDLGIIKFIDIDCIFPWDFFTNGKINCAFQTENSINMNDIRIWINSHAEESVYIAQSRYGNNPCKLAFTAPGDAAKFALTFGDIIKKYK